MAANLPVNSTGSAVPAHRALKPSAGGGRLGGFENLFRKEMGDWFHTRRWLKQLIIWLGIINVFIAFVLFAAPQIDLAQGGGSLPGADEQAATGLELFFNFAVTGGAIGVIIIALDEIVGEKTTGTAAWILSKPLSRMAFILSKLAANAIGILLFVLLIPALVGYIEIWLAARKWVPLVPYLGGLGIAALALLFYLTLATMLGVLLDSRGGVVGISLAVLLGGSILVNLTQVIVLILPVAMQNFASMIARGQPLPQAAWTEIGTTAAWCVIFVAVSLWRFEKLEL